MSTSHEFHKRRRVPVALTIAGSDNSGGAGIQADLKTFTTFKVFGAAAVTCLVAEHPGKVRCIDPAPVASVRDQIDLVFEAFPVAALKTGMLYSKGIIDAVAQSVKTKKCPIVIDPVMVATSGAVLLKKEAIHVLCQKLIPHAAVVTPNRDEAELLWGEKITSLPALRQAAHELSSRFGVPFLVKGGHLKMDEAVDVLCSENEIHHFRAPTVKGVDPHGTGCTYSAAITAGLARGLSLFDAVTEAKKFITRAIRDHFTLGPYQMLNHF